MLNFRDYVKIISFRPISYRQQNRDLQNLIPCKTDFLDFLKKRVSCSRFLLFYSLYFLL